MDLIGALPKTARGKLISIYVVTLVDYFGKWPEAAALQDKTV